MLACGEREAIVIIPPLTYDSAALPCFNGCLAFLHIHFWPQSPPSHPFDPSLHSQQQHLPLGCSTIPKLQPPATAPSRGPSFPVQGMYGCGKDCLILIPYRLPQVSFFTFSLKYFSSDSDNCPSLEIRPLLQFPHPPKAGPVLLILLFPPLVASSYQVLHDSIYSFPLVRYFCLLSDGVLPTLLCLKVYSRYIHGERYTPHPPTPPPSCYFTSVFSPGESTWTEEPGRLQSIASQSQTWLSK